MKTYTYTIKLEPAEEGGYVVTVPALSPCLTQGDTYEEAISMAKDCIEGYLELLAEEGEPIPVEAPLLESSPHQVAITVRVPHSAPSWAGSPR